MPKRTGPETRAPRATSRAATLVGTVTDATRRGLDNQAAREVPLRGKIENRDRKARTMTAPTETQRDTTLTPDTQHTWAQAVTFTAPDAFNDDPIYFRTRGEAMTDIREWLETDTWYAAGRESANSHSGLITDRRTGETVGTWSVHQVRP